MQFREDMYHLLLNMLKIKNLLIGINKHYMKMCGICLLRPVQAVCLPYPSFKQIPIYRPFKIALWNTYKNLVLTLTVYLYKSNPEWLCKEILPPLQQIVNLFYRT